MKQTWTMTLIGYWNTMHPDPNDGDLAPQSGVWETKNDIEEEMLESIDARLWEERLAKLHG